MKLRTIIGGGKPLIERKEYITGAGAHTFTVPPGCKFLDIFLVGGGGGGGSWATWGYTGGMPGLGGDAFTAKQISVTPGQVIDITVGAGGKRAKNYTEEAKSATNGGATTVTINGVIYKAKGGIGGANSSSTNDEFYLYEKFGKEKRFGGDYNGHLWWDSVSEDIADQDCHLLYPDGRSYGDVIPKRTREYRLGIHEFFEWGQPIHAGHGSYINWENKFTTDFPIENEAYSSNYGYYCYSGGGYGGGGFGGSYGGKAVEYGGDGGAGVVVLRYKSY